MSDINWAGLNRGPNIFSELTQGLQYGNDVRRENERDNLFAQRQEFEIGQARRKQTLEDQQLQRRSNAAAAVAKGDYAGARTAAEGDFDLLTSIGQLDETQRKAARDRAEDLGGFAAALKSQPYEARRAILEQAKGTLAEYGFTPEQLAGFDPTDQALDAQVASAMDLKTALSEAARLRDDERADDQAAEVRRHNGVTEGQGAARVGLARQREGRVAAGRGRSGGGGLPPPPSGWSR